MGHALKRGTRSTDLSPKRQATQKKQKNNKSTDPNQGTQKTMLLVTKLMPVHSFNGSLALLLG